MKKSWAMKWAKDLETTRAKQAKGVLNDGAGGFCCLGRLCVVAGLRATRDPLDPFPMSYSGGATQALPDDLATLVGMKTVNGEYTRGITLASLNDSGTSFPEIAKIIRKHWKSL